MDSPLLHETARSGESPRIDQGTSATKAVVFGDDREVLASVEVPVAPGRSRGRMNRIRTTVGVGVQPPGAGRWGGRRGRGSNRLCQPGRDGAGLGPQQRMPTECSGVLAGPTGRFDLCRAGRPVQALTAATGLPLDPYFAAPKMSWLRDT